MTDLMAVIGMEQLKKLKSFNLKRTLIMKRYIKALKKFKNIFSAFPYKFNGSSYWMFTVRCKKRWY